MKKILLTTTALTMLAGAAVAEISTTGDARMGVTSTGGATSVTHRYRVHFNASGETDGGLTFGAKAGIRWDQASTTNIYSSSAFIGNGAMTVRVGNTGGAITSAAGIWGASTLGFTGMSANAAGLTWAHQTTSTGGAGINIVAVDFALGGANMTLSTEVGGDSEIAANFSAGAATIGIGFDTGAAADGGTTLTVGYDAGSANLHVNYFQDAAGATSYSLSASMGVGAGTVKAYIASIGGAASHGLSYSQSLGGGASLGLGYEDQAGTASMEAGVSFGF
jgi:outer membrane protein OmpU